MNRLLVLVLEVATLFVFFLLASLLSLSLRRRCRAQELTASTAGPCLLNLLGRLLRPALALILSWVFAPYANRIFGVEILPARHLLAWELFWEGIFVLGLVEGLAVLFFRVRSKPFPVPELMRNILRALAVVAVVFGVMKLVLGVNISPLLGASALLTAVVGFALQGVLGNLLAGISLHVVRSVVPGDWIAVGDVEGEVIETNWRETRLRTVAGHIMVVPNSTVSAATLHNMTHPTPLRRHRVDVGASYSDAPGDVIAALVEAAGEVPDVLRDPPPSALVVEYKDFGINYRLRFWSNQYYNRTPIEGDVMRMIWYKFKRRGIEIPFPMSDKLLNDFMDVVYTQRRLQSDEKVVDRTAEDLRDSDFIGRMLVDEQGASLLKAEDLREVARLVRRVRFTSGETVFRQGDPGDTCYVVVAGQVHGRVEYKDAQQPHEFELGRRALFGEMSLVTGLPRTATISARAEVELLEVSSDAFTKLLALRKDIPEILSRLVADRAAQNAAALEKLKSVSGIGDSLKRDSILKRFLKMLGR